jgi:hypothetical protein
MMRGVYFLIPLGLGAVGALATFFTWPQEQPATGRLAAEVAAGADAARPAGAASMRSPGAPPTAPRPATRAPAPPTEDPEALTTWFQEQVERHLELGEVSARTGDQRLSVLANPEAGRPIRIASVGASQPADGENAGSDPSRRSGRHVDWEYLQGVFEGRISGIPNEAKAGLTLQEIDELGEIPYVEELRREGRYEELRDLGFENETTPWPACIRKGTCRRDGASSPP